MSRLCALLLLSLSFVQSTSALQFPEGMSFVGLSQDGWLAYLVDDRSGQPKPIATSSEPRSPTWSMADNGMAYLDAGGQLVVKKNGTESEIVLAKPDKERAFAQPVFSPDGQTLYVVELKKGISVNTDILAIRIDSPELKPVVQQRSAQFDPYKTIDGYLYYANVTCVLGCGKIIQELWRKQLV